MRLAPIVQTNRTSNATATIINVIIILFVSAVLYNKCCNKYVILVIITILAIREHHCSKTLPVTYFLLVPIVPINRLLIIINLCYPLI